MNKLKWGFPIAGILAIIAVNVSCNSTSFSEITASLPDLAGKPDGVYRGNYDLTGTPLKVTLDVTLQNEDIKSVNIINHTCSPIGRKAEKITADVIQNQSLGVDAVSGATGSSKTILKAIENALQ